MPTCRRRPRQNRHYRIDHELKPDDLAAYRAYLREPRTTNKSAHAWLVGRGYTTFSESAVARHKRHFLALRAGEEQSLERARQWSDLAREVRGDGGDVVDGAVILTEVMACRALFDADVEDMSDTDLVFYGQLVSRLVQTRVRLTKLRLAAGQGAAPAAPRDAADWTAPAPATEEEKHEAMLKKICQRLRTPYLTPEQRAESAKAWQEFEQRRLSESPSAAQERAPAGTSGA